jgi:DNA helicase-2/ATP-dependent DNA helicase PcrA
VYVIHAADGNIPSDMSTGSDDEIEEERRLFYVACTRARDHLYVTVPLRYYVVGKGPTDRHGYAQPTRFVTERMKPLFAHATADTSEDADAPAAGGAAADVRARVKKMWA